jgi:glycosyltransferase involved in cell wall biosynthesis
MGVNNRPWSSYRLGGSRWQWLRLRLESFVLRRADIVLCNSQIAGDELVANSGCARERVQTVRNPIEVDRLTLAASQARNRESPLGVTPFLMSAGRLCGGKGFSEVIRAYAAVAASSDAHLVICGDGGLRQSLEAEAVSLGVGERVHFVGWHDDLIPYYAHCRAFVFGSYHEGLPNVVLEAMAAGAVVISTRCTSWISVFEEQGACLGVEVGDVTGLSSGIRRVSEDLLLCDRLRCSAEKVIRDFSLEKVARDRSEYLRRLLSGKHGV